MWFNRDHAYYTCYYSPSVSEKVKLEGYRHYLVLHISKINTVKSPTVKLPLVL